jgi:hypothetical protein
VSLLAQDTRLTRRVGAVALVVMTLAIVFFVFVYDRIELGSPLRIRVYFTATGGLTEGAPFVVAGRTIGHIESIALSPRGADSPLHGEEGVVAIVALDRELAGNVVKGGDIFVTSRGALSVRYLELGPPPGPGPVLADGDQFRGNDPPSLDRVLQRTWDNLNTTKRFLDDVRPEAHALGVELDKLQATLLQIAPQILLRDDFSALLAEARRTYAAFGGAAGFARIDGIRADAGTVIAEARADIAKLRATATLLGASLDALKAKLGGKGTEVIDRIEVAIDRIEAVTAKVDPLLAQIDAIAIRIERGEGSLMKLARDPEFPEDAKELGKILKRQPWKIIDRPPN